MDNRNYYSCGIFGNVNPVNFGKDDCLNEMIEKGFEDNVLNGWKLAIYNGNVDLACQYYYYDEWCHQHCIFGICKNDYQCKGSHRFDLANLIDQKNFQQAKLLCQYLLYFYTNRCVKQNIHKKRTWIAHLHWKLAQVYGRDGLSDYCDHKIAQSHYEHAINVYVKC